MTKRRHYRWLMIGAGLALMLTPTRGFGQAGDRITSYVDAGGRRVYTNFATAPARATITPTPSPVAAATQSAFRPTPYDAMIQTLSSRHGVDSRLVRAVVEVESNFQRNAVSAKGAQGLMQLIPETGARFGVRDPFDPAQNIEGGVRYLSYLLDMFEGNLDLSLAAYNSGENRVARLGRVPRIRETQDYVQKVRAAYQRMGGAGTALRTHPPVPASALARVAEDTSPRPTTGGASAAPPVVGSILRLVDESGIRTFTNQ